MRTLVKSFLFASLLLLVSACHLFPTPTDVDEFESSVEIIEIDQLENVDNFREGALTHIFEGELNRKGHAVGYHYEGLPDTPGSVIEGTRTDPDSNGVYEAEVEVSGVKKSGNQGISSFFPLHWTSQEVVDAINEAYETKELLTGNTYEGISEEGITIHMYLDDNEKIISAFPIF